MLLAIDPGTEQSGWVVLEKSGNVLDSGIDANADVYEMLRNSEHDYYAIEWIESMGMPVGQEVFETVWWCGMFASAIVPEFWRVTRREVKLHLCGSMRAKDANVRASLIDRFGPGRDKAIGTKKHPGPLYGINSHSLSALAVGVTFLETRFI